MFLIMSEYLFGFRNDVTYDLYGYIFITLNNIFSAANGIYTKKKLNNTVKLNTLNNHGTLTWFKPFL